MAVRRRVGRRSSAVLAGLAMGWSLAATAAPAAAQGPERIFYMTGAEASRESFRGNVEHMDVVAPQVFAVTADGFVQGQLDPAMLELAREHDVRVMPLVHNRGFNQDTIHALLHDPAARARAVRAMVEIGRRDRLWGWQFDFENIHIGERDSLTAFYREAALALHDAGMILSIAVVPFTGRIGTTAWHRYMHDNWRGAFDLPALAAIGDFISYMTYAQHNVGSPPGPVAGLPWIRENLDHALAAGVPPERISLGLPFYSGYWAPGYDTTRTGTDGLRPVYRELHHDEAMEILHHHDATPQWLPEQGTSMAVWEDQGVFHFLFLEDARAFAAKLELLDEYPGLRGVSVWVLGAEDADVWGEEGTASKVPRGRMR